MGHIYLYINGIHDFWMAFSLSIMSLNKFFYKKIILFLSLKKLRIYILFVILLVSKKKNTICYNLKVTEFYNYNFNQNFIKNDVHNLNVLGQ